jgi:hypothetical protein
VDVHIPQSRDRKLSNSIDPVHITRQWRAAANGGDPAVAHHNREVAPNCGGFSVNNRDPGDGEGGVAQRLF